MNKLPIDEETGHIDGTKVHNVSLHFDGVNYYYTAVVNGVFSFIIHSSELKNWLINSGLYIVDMSKFWEMEIPKDENLIDLENVPSTTIKKKFKR